MKKHPKLPFSDILEFVEVRKHMLRLKQFFVSLFIILAGSILGETVMTIDFQLP